MTEPTSWLAIEPGWELSERSGAVIGEITEVVGDPDADIFDGLRFEQAGGGELYVPADRVGPIVEGRVQLAVEASELPAESGPGGAELSRDRESEL